MEELFLIESSTGRRRRAKHVSCTHCNVQFLKMADWCEGVNFCSVQCNKTYKSIQRIQYDCAKCGEKFHSDKSRINGSKSGKLFCSRSCKDSAQRIDGCVPEILPAHYGKGESRYRMRAFMQYDAKCDYCGYDNLPDILEVHHIDGNRRNGKITNLIILCPNHHAAITKGFADIDSNRNYVWKSRKS
jgi:phage terminase large subunit GpA-like protein